MQKRNRSLEELQELTHSLWARFGLKCIDAWEDYLRVVRPAWDEYVTRGRTEEAFEVYRQVEQPAFEQYMEARWNALRELHESSFSDFLATAELLMGGREEK